MGLKQKIREMEYEYQLDQRELGKILFIVSITLLMFSLISFYQTRSTINDIEQLNEDFSQLDAVVNSEAFNNSLSSIENLQGVPEAQEYQYAAETFRGMQHGLDEADNAEERLQYLKKLYQWLTLLSLLGVTAGITVIFI